MAVLRLAADVDKSHSRVSSARELNFFAKMRLALAMCNNQTVIAHRH